MIREHELKTWPVYFDAIDSGDKTFEVRKDDRGFQKGDTLILKEWIPYNEDAFLSSDRKAHFSGREIRRRVLWILTGGQFGVEPGYVIMALDGGDA